MPRPRMRRWVASAPKATYFKPHGVPLRALTEVRLPLEGLEALRLADLEGMTTEAAATRMGVSRHTFGRVLADARANVSRALVEGWALRIEGGHYEMADDPQAERAREAQDGGAGPVVAIPTQGPALDALVAPRVEQAPGFALVDLADRSVRYIGNGWQGRRGRHHGRGPGMHTLHFLREAGADILLASPSCPDFGDAVAQAGLRFIAYPPLPQAETVGQAVERLAKDLA